MSTENGVTQEEFAQLQTAAATALKGLKALQELATDDLLERLKEHYQEDPNEYGPAIMIVLRDLAGNPVRNDDLADHVGFLEHMINEIAQMMHGEIVR